MRFLSILLVFMLGATVVDAADFYISPDGSDQWAGSLEKPFATLQKARDAVRELNANRDVVVQIRGGQYRLSETVVFGVEDSGKDDFTITYEAYPDEIPVFHSDAEITNWKQKDADGKVWVADVPKEKFYTLYDASGRLPRARSKGFIPVMPPSNKENSKNTRVELHYPEGALRNWPNLADVEIMVRPHHAWVVNILPLKSINEKARIATTSVAATYAMDELHYLKGTESVWVENVIEALDEPGEWVLNTAEGKLYLWPRTEGPPKGIVAPQLREYIKVEGKIDIDDPGDTPVRNLIFRGLTLTRGEAYRLKSEDKGLQHDWEFYDKANALLRLRGTENCTVEKCRFTQSGAGAIRMDLHGQNNRIQSNHIEHIGSTGILLCGYGPGTKDVNHHNLVYNNHIHHVGEIYPHAPGIFLWQSGENRVANNLVHHTPYAGIIVSGVMTDFFSKKGNARELVRTIRRKEVGKNRTLEEIRPFLHSHDNLVEYNEIHHAMEQLGDGNGIYIRGAGAGNIIRRNYIHHLVSPVALQSAIRTDGGQRDTLIAENLIYRCTSQGIQLKLNNRAVNNIIADLIEPIHNGEKRLPAYLKLREGPMTGAVIQRNILYHPVKKADFFDQGRNRRLTGARASEADTDYNIYYCAGDPELSRAVLIEARRSGIDKNSRADDPLFIDPAKGDFRLKPDSPALKMGIVPIDLSKIGLRE
ncbi:MAG: right-handed parallel beta-helix repeat-containing protein [Verrucomicrobiales bacterium]|nr:right-handed parallel beta-helix repeat-containing protein [Verrucomicrobiales bacterium]